MASPEMSARIARRERRGSEKRQIGIGNIQRMLPGAPNGLHGGEVPPDTFSPDMALMSMEDSYGDMWDRLDVIDARTRSILNVSLMIGVGNVGNQFELGWHAPAAVYNGVTVDELEAMIVHARPYVGSPCAAWAMQSIVTALEQHALINRSLPAADLARREATGSEKRAVAREVLREMDPDSPLLQADDQLQDGGFGAELSHMILETIYFDLWARTEVLDRKTRSIVTLGLLMGVGNHKALADHVPIAIRNGVTIPELEEFVYQAATYLGFVSGTTIHETITRSLGAAGAAGAPG